jgi:CRP/FNR family cyclic AMP-dependent transcriptional regulator
MTKEILRNSDLCKGLSDEEFQKIASLAKRFTHSTGEYLFMLGDAADHLYVVLEGKVALCFPMSFGDVMKDVTVESARPGQTLGWSTMVKPYRFTLSARATETTQLVSFLRSDLLRLFENEPRIGYLVTTEISELLGFRLLRGQALWARELQRTVDAEAAISKHP